MARPEADVIEQGRGLLAAGRLEEAERLLDGYLADVPADPVARRLRGELAIRQGAMEEARRQLEAAAKAAPPDVPLLHLLAGACHATGDSGAAIGHLQRALDLSPEEPRLWHSLGLVCHGAGRYQAALDAYQRAIAIDPGMTASAVGLGKVRQLLGDLETARDIFAQALAREPGNLEALGGLVLQEELLGNVERALDLLESVRRRGPLPADLAIAWARLQQRAGKPRDSVQALEAILPRIADVQTRAHALFALGRALDDLGETERAFAAIAEANALKPRDFAAKTHRLRLRNIAAAWTRPAMDALSGMGNPSAKPVFIVGMPRSGTSLVEQILSRHPSIYACGELGAVGELASAWQDEEGVVQPNTLNASRLQSASAAYLQRAGAGDADCFTDKMPANFMHLGLIQALFPSARVIHCRRDPLDVGLSCFFQDFSALGLSWSCRLEDIAAYYESYAALMEHWRATVDLPLLDLDYEDLVADLEVQVRRLLAFLGLPWDAACLAFQDSDRPVKTASFDQVNRGLYATAVGRHAAYRNHLGPLLGLSRSTGGGR